MTEARCPTFSWAGVDGASGYELAIFRVAGDAEVEPELVRRVSLPARTPSWTPSVGACLERGGRYAWSVAVARSDSEPQWAEPVLFTVQAAPSLDEVEQALSVLRRYEESAGQASARDPADAEIADQGARGKARRRPRQSATRSARAAPVRGARRSLARPGCRPGLGASVAGCGLSAPTSGERIASAATAPAYGPASLTVSSQVHLGASSAIFKNGDPFLWSDTSANSALGGNALSANTTGGSNTATGFSALRSNTEGSSNTATGASALRSSTYGSENTATGAFALYSNLFGTRNTATGASALYYTNAGDNTATGAFALFFNTTGVGNTAVGSQALYFSTTGGRNTAVGITAMYNNTTGQENTAVGSLALYSNTSGYDNVATGGQALFKNISGNYNTALGQRALFFNSSGDDNTAVGAGALSNAFGSGNIALGRNAGSTIAAGGNNIAIGNSGSTNDSNTIRLGNGSHTKTLIAGIRDVTTDVADAIPVVIDSSGQLGTASSSRRVKRDIRDLGAFAERVLALRPVAFRFRRHVEADPDTPLQFGLIAEEVAKVFPELVVYDEDGRPATVKYHLLSTLLLGQLEKQHDLVARQQGELRRLRARIERLEARERKRSRRPERRTASRSP